MERTDLARIVAFTDGVLAVAITLLALNIDVPDLPSGREDELGEELVDLLPSLAAYAMAFALVGRYWVIHHGLFQRLRAFDGTLMGLNLLFLALLVLVPFSTDLVDSYDDEPVAAAVFAAILGLAALVNGMMIRHVLRRELVHEHARDLTAAVSLGLAFLFFLSVPLAFVATWLAHILWVAAIFVRYPLRRLAG
jgi:uncharacterized membrane protein